MKPVPIFDLSDTHGLPFEILALELQERGLLPDWEDFMCKAIARLWTPHRIWKAAEEIAGPFGWWPNEEFQLKLKLIFMRAMRGAEETS